MNNTVSVSVSIPSHLWGELEQWVASKGYHLQSVKTARIPSPATDPLPESFDASVVVRLFTKRG